METFGARLRRLREAAGFGLNQFAELVGISRSYLSRIERDERLVDSEPRRGKLRTMADILGVTPEQLLGEEALPGEAAREKPWYVTASDEELMERVGITVAPPQIAALVEGLSLHAGEYGNPVPQDLEDTFGRLLHYEVKRGDPIRWYRVFGTCMEPKINDGDWVFIDRDLPIEPDKFVAAIIHGEQAVARKLTKANGRFWLETLDGAKPVLVTEGIRIIGRIRNRQSYFA